ncbi:hypothetical protein ACYOEI_35750 [Singulisphaera rosea]
MVREQQVRETIDSCLATLDRYHDTERWLRSKAKLVAEIAVVVGRLSDWETSLGDAVELVAIPVGERLVGRYGSEVGRRLDADFMAAFELALADARQAEFAGTHERLIDHGQQGTTASGDEGSHSSPWT